MGYSARNFPAVLCYLPAVETTGAQPSLATRRIGVTHTQATPTRPQCLLHAITHIAEAPVVLFLAPSQFQHFLSSGRDVRNPSSGACSECHYEDRCPSVRFRVFPQFSSLRKVFTAYRHSHFLFFVNGRQGLGCLCVCVCACVIPHAQQIHDS